MKTARITRPLGSTHASMYMDTRKSLNFERACTYIATGDTARQYTLRRLQQQTRNRYQ